MIFVDETSVSQRPFVTRTWAPRGETPIFSERFSWKRLSAMIAVTTGEQLFFTLREGAFNGDDAAEFLARLLRKISGRILLVWDNVAIHRGPAVRALLARHDVRRRLEILRLPPYAPELNPEELLNAQLKCRRLANRSPDSLGRLVADTRGNLLAMSKDRAALRALLLSRRHGLIEEKDLVKLSCRDH